MDHKFLISMIDFIKIVLVIIINYKLLNFINFMIKNSNPFLFFYFHKNFKKKYFLNLHLFLN